MPEYAELRELFLAKSREADGLREEMATMRRDFMSRLEANTAELAKANERIAELVRLLDRKKKRRKKPDAEVTPDPPQELTEAQREAFANRPQAPMPRGALHD